MQFAEALRWVRIALLCAALASCAAQHGKHEPSAGAGVSAAAGAAPRPATGAGAPAEPQAAVVSPEVLRAFDNSTLALQQGRLEEAERGFLELVRSNPDLGGPHANLGIIYRHAGKLAQAISELEAAVHSNPQQPVFWNQLGITYREQGQFTKAREAYEKAIAIDPSYSAPYLNLGILFDLYLWDGKRALDLYDQYLAQSPGGDPTVTKWVADLKIRNRETAGAPKEKQ